MGAELVLSLELVLSTELWVLSVVLEETALSLELVLLLDEVSEDVE